MKQRDAAACFATIERLALDGYSTTIERGPFDNEWTVYVSDRHERERGVAKPWNYHVHTHNLSAALRQVDERVSERADR